MSPSRILIVEDDTFKIERIQNCLSVAPTINITLVTSVQSAVAAVEGAAFDVILLDMSLPSHEVKPGGAPASNLLSGGIEIILELAYSQRSESVIVITQYPEIEIDGVLVPIQKVDDAIRQMCDVNLAGVIHYKHEETAWELSLLKLLGI